MITKFYHGNSNEIDALSNEILTIQFNSDKKGKKYTKAKIIDMYGFIKGYQIRQRKGKKTQK